MKTAILESVIYEYLILDQILKNLTFLSAFAKPADLFIYIFIFIHRNLVETNRKRYNGSMLTVSVD